MSRPPREPVKYRANCQECKHEWTSKVGYGTPDYCPNCRSRMLTIKALPTPVKQKQG